MTSHLAHRKTNLGFTLVELLLVAAIVAVVAVFAIGAARGTINTERANKVENLTREVGNAKSYYLNLTGESLVGLDDDSRWLLIANYMQLTPASAATNRYDLLNAFSSYSTFTIGSEHEATVIGP